MSAPDLLPCPFCGCEADLIDTEEDFGAPIVGAGCTECPAACTVTLAYGSSEEEITTERAAAIAAWNTRTEGAAK